MPNNSVHDDGLGLVMYHRNYRRARPRRVITSLRVATYKGANNDSSPYSQEQTRLWTREPTRRDTPQACTCRRLCTHFCCRHVLLVWQFTKGLMVISSILSGSPIGFRDLKFTPSPSWSYSATSDCPRSSHGRTIFIRGYITIRDHNQA